MEEYEKGEGGKEFRREESRSDSCGLTGPEVMELFGDQQLRPPPATGLLPWRLDLSR